jgi:hypothetical protein
MEQPEQEAALPTKPTPDKLKEFGCSVCGKTFRFNPELMQNNGHMRSAVALPRFKDYGRNGGHKYLYCSLSCGEAIGKAISMANSGISMTPAPGNEGRIVV